MTDKYSDITENALAILIEKITTDQTIPEDLKSGMCIAVKSEDPEKISGVADLIRIWVNANEDIQTSTE